MVHLTLSINQFSDTLLHTLYFFIYNILNLKSIKVLGMVCIYYVYTAIYISGMLLVFIRFYSRYFLSNLLIFLFFLISLTRVLIDSWNFHPTNYGQGIYCILKVYIYCYKVIILWDYVNNFGLYS